MKEAVAVKRFSKVLAEAMPGCVIFKHYDLVTAGIPDLSVTWNRKTCWLEVKVDDYHPSPIQRVVMNRLHQHGLAFFVHFYTGNRVELQNGDGTQVMIDNLDPYQAAALFVRGMLRQQF